MYAWYVPSATLIKKAKGPKATIINRSEVPINTQNAHQGIHALVEVSVK